MRQARPADVVEAVRYVTGNDPCSKSRIAPVTAAKRLAVHALEEICELNLTGSAAVLGLEHSTVWYHRGFEPDYDALRAVVAYVSDKLETEDYERRVKKAEREAALWT